MRLQLALLTCAHTRSDTKHASLRLPNKEVEKDSASLLRGADTVVNVTLFVAVPPSAALWRWHQLLHSDHLGFECFERLAQKAVLSFTPFLFMFKYWNGNISRRVQLCVWITCCSYDLKLMKPITIKADRH